MTDLHLLARSAATGAQKTATVEECHAIADAVYTVVSTEYEKEIERLKAESAPVDQQRLVNRLLDLADFHHRMIPRYGPFHVEAEAVLREVVTKLTPHPAPPVDQQEIERLKGWPLMG